MKDTIKDLLKKSIDKTYSGRDFTDLIEVQNVTAKNIEADYYTNISMKLAKLLKKNPTEIANKIIKSMDELDDIKFNVVKPGYINFLVKDSKRNNIISVMENQFYNKSTKVVHRS